MTPPASPRPMSQRRMPRRLLGRALLLTIPAAAAVATLAAPALALATTPAHHLYPRSVSMAPSIPPERADGAIGPVTCNAWEPAIPGLLYLGTAPVLTIGGVPLIGSGNCLPADNGRGHNLQTGVNLAIPPRSVCAPEIPPLPLLRISLGLAIGTPDPDGYGPCHVRLSPIPAPSSPVVTVPQPPARSPRPVPIGPRPPVPIGPRPPVPIGPRPPVSIAPPRPGRHAPPRVVPPPVAPPLAVRPPATAPRAVAIPAAVPVLHAPLPRPVAQNPAAPKPAAPRLAPPQPGPPAPRPGAPQQQAASTFHPGRPVMPTSVLITVVLTPCVVTVAARLGKLMVGRV